MKIPIERSSDYIVLALQATFSCLRSIDNIVQSDAAICQQKDEYYKRNNTTNYRTNLFSKLDFDYI
jgi:hypothetical protein